MTIRLKVLRQQEQRINKMKDMMENMYPIKLPGVSYPNYNYQPVGGSSVTNDPKIQATKNLFQMFHADR